MITTKDVMEAMQSSIGTEHYYKTSFPDLGLVYTDGVKYFAQKCNAYWVIDLVNSYMNSVLKEFKDHQETMFFIELKVTEGVGKFRMYKSFFDEVTCEEIEKTVAEQEIPYKDLPNCEIKMYLQLGNYDPLMFVLLCPSEY